MIPQGVAAVYLAMQPLRVLDRTPHYVSLPRTTTSALLVLGIYASGGFFSRLGAPQIAILSWYAVLLFVAAALHGAGPVPRNRPAHAIAYSLLEALVLAAGGFWKGE